MNPLSKYLLTVIGGMGIFILTGLGWIYLRDYDRLEMSIVITSDNTRALQEGFAVLNQILANQDDDIGEIKVRVGRLENPQEGP